jgi:hypothetical protein
MATVALYPSTGPQITSSYDGATSSTFTANGVPDGTVWVAVLPTNPSASAAWATVSSVTTPQITAASVPIVDAPTLTAIASTLPSLGTKGVSATLTHVVLQLTHQGTPYAGVEVTGGTAGGVVAYDVATGTYSDSATATGAQGTALVLDASLSPGFATLTVTDPSTHKSWPVTLLTGTGAVTLVSVELD